MAVEWNGRENVCCVMGDFAIPGEIHKKKWWTILSCQEKASIPEGCLSPKQIEHNTNKQSHKTHNSHHQQYLLQTMWDKHQYFVCGETLDFYLQQRGGDSTSLNCCIVFNVMEEWFKSYVDKKHSAQRTSAKRNGLEWAQLPTNT